VDEISHIQHAHQAVTIAEQQLIDAVAQARASGHSWADIGAALNISRQAAFKRFATVSNPFTGETLKPQAVQDLPTLAEKFLQHIARDEEAEAKAMMHSTTRRELPWSEIAEVWTRVLTEIGELEGFEDSVVTTVRGTRDESSLLGKISEKILGTAVVVTTLKHEAGEVMGRVAFDRDQNVIGILILPVDATEFVF